jgi:hypothetical protein
MTNPWLLLPGLWRYLHRHRPAPRVELIVGRGSPPDSDRQRHYGHWDTFLQDHPPPLVSRQSDSVLKHLPVEFRYQGYPAGQHSFCATRIVDPSFCEGDDIVEQALPRQLSEGALAHFPDDAVSVGAADA